MKIARISKMDNKIKWGDVVKVITNSLPPINKMEVDSGILDSLINGPTVHLRECGTNYLNTVDKAVSDYKDARRLFCQTFSYIVEFLKTSGVHLTGGRAGVCIYLPEAFYFWNKGVIPSQAHYALLNNQDRARSVKQIPSQGTVIVVEPTNGLNNKVFCTVQVYTHMFGFTLSFKDGELDSWNFFTNLPSEAKDNKSQGGICIYPERIRMWINAKLCDKSTGMYTFIQSDEMYSRPYHMNGKYSISNIESFVSIQPSSQSMQMNWALRSTDSY